MLSRLKMAAKRSAFTEGAILDAIFRNTKLIELLYNDFSLAHMPAHLLEARFERKRTLSGHRRSLSVDEESSQALSEQEAISRITKMCSSESDASIFQTFLVFNRHVLKTNFYKERKLALAFRLDPGFLSPADYPDRPHGVYFVVGAEFRAFHVRQQNVARGGIRLVRSPYHEAFARNTAAIFDECYNLANTQQRKNKVFVEAPSSRPFFVLEFWARC